MTDKYEDIIDLPRHISKEREPMPNKDRAAQFAPFAALTGHYEEVKEAARVTEKRIDLDYYMKERLNQKLQVLTQKVTQEPEIIITYFKPDDKKDGGAYITTRGRLRKIDQYKKCLLINDIKVPIKEIIEIESNTIKL
ncbi:MAG TPA: hypothetical protein VIG40_03175 [Tissierellaceae bacterium]